MNELHLQYRSETGLNPCFSDEKLDALKPARVNNSNEAVSDFITELTYEFDCELGEFQIPSPAYVRWLENKLKELQK